MPTDFNLKIQKNSKFPKVFFLSLRQSWLYNIDYSFMYILKKSRLKFVAALKFCKYEFWQLFFIFHQLIPIMKLFFFLNNPKRIRIKRKNVKRINFSCCWGSIDDLYICPSNIILSLFCLLVIIPDIWYNILVNLKHKLIHNKFIYRIMLWMLPQKISCSKETTGCVSSK